MLQFVCLPFNCIKTSPCYSCSCSRGSTAQTFPWQLINNRIASTSILYITGWRCLHKSLLGSVVILQWRSEEKSIYNENVGSLHTNTAVGEREELFLQELHSNNMYYVRQRFHTVLNLLSLRNSTRCMGVRFVRRKELKSFLRFNISKKHFYSTYSTMKII